MVSFVDDIMMLYSMTVFLFTLLADPSICGGLVPSTLVQQIRTINPSNDVPIVQQLKQSNLDGSYTFGYESADGSFRTETRDVDGFVTGRYGYIDPNGQLREFDYVAGSRGLGNVGFQVRDSLVNAGSLMAANTAEGFAVADPGIEIADVRLATTDPTSTSFIQDPTRQIIVQQEPSLTDQVLIQQQPIQQSVRQQVIAQPTINNRFQQQQQLLIRPQVVVQQPAIRFQQPQITPQISVQPQPARQIIVEQPLVQQQSNIRQIIAPQRQLLYSSRPADPFSFQSQRIVVQQQQQQPGQFINQQRQQLFFNQQPTAFANRQLFGQQQIFQGQSQFGLGLRTQNPFAFTQQQVVPFTNEQVVNPFIGDSSSLFGIRQFIDINDAAGTRSGFVQQQPSFVTLNNAAAGTVF